MDRPSKLRISAPAEAASDPESPPTTSMRRRRRNAAQPTNGHHVELPEVQFPPSQEEAAANGAPNGGPDDAALPDAVCRRLRALPDRPTELELAKLRDQDLRALLAGLGLPRVNRGGKAPMVASLVRWLYERPESPLPLPRGLQRPSRQAPPSNSGQSAGQNAGSGAPSRSPASTNHLQVNDVDAPPQLPTSNPFQLPRASTSSMDVDAPDQDADRETNRDQQTEPAILSTVPPLPPPPGLQSTTAPNSSLEPLSPPRKTPSYAAIASGASTTLSGASGTAALSAILERAQKALQAVVQASAAVQANPPSPAPWPELTELASESLRELAAAHAGIAAADALRPSRASDPPSAPQRPPPDQPSRAAPLAAWDDRRCIVVDPPDDRLRRAATDIEGMGAALTAALRPVLNAPQGRVVDQLRRTAKGGYCAQICAPHSDQARALKALKIGDQGTWSSSPLRQTRRPSNGGPTNSRPPEIRRDSFVLSPVPDSLDASAVIAAFSRDNAARLGLSPTALAARLTRAERLQRRLSRGPQAGSWVASRSVRITGDPALVASIIAANHAVLGFHSVEVRQFSLPTLHCFHCGAAGHVARHCRARCHRCDRRHPTQPCPRRPEASDCRDRREGPRAEGLARPGGQLRPRFPSPDRRTRQTGGPSS